LFDAAEEALDEIAMFVSTTIKHTLHVSSRLWRHDDAGVDAVDGVDQAVGVVGFLGHHGLGFEALDQRLSFRQILGLASSERLTRQLFQPLDQTVNIGGQPAPRTAERLIAFFWSTGGMLVCSDDGGVDKHLLEVGEAN
jgi:hypothetical protein